MNARRFAGIAAGLTMLSVAGAACSDDESVFNAEVGECVQSISDLTGNISDLPESDCTEDHEAEIIALFEHEGDDDDFPGGSELQAEAAEECEGDAFEDYTGTEYAESAIVVNYITPSDESWGGGDRETICVGSLITGDDVDVSFEDNGEDFLLEDAAGGGGDGEETETTDGGDSGEDTSVDDFADLIDSCEGGDMADCDTLFQTTPVGSEAEEIGLSCGGERDSATAASSCEDEFG